MWFSSKAEKTFHDVSVYFDFDSFQTILLTATETLQRRLVRKMSNET